MFILKKKLGAELAICGWNSLSELRPLYSLKSNPPGSN